MPALVAYVDADPLEDERPEEDISELVLTMLRVGETAGTAGVGAYKLWP